MLFSYATFQAALAQRKAGKGNELVTSGRQGKLCAGEQAARFESMLPPRLLALVFLAWTAPGNLSAATIEGKVELPKTHRTPVAANRYEIVTSGGVLATDPPLSVVYLEVPPSARPPALPTRQVAQKNLAFQPPLLPVQVGTKVEFPNLDDTFHNIFSYSPAKRFDLGRYRPDEKPVPFQIFDKPGLVTLRCDIHEHMRGLILVLTTPHFVVTNDKGEFRLTNVPAGQHAIKAWIDSKTTRETTVDLKEGATLHVDFP
jgi:plastocyanin